MEFSPDGSLFALLDPTDKLIIWDVKKNTDTRPIDRQCYSAFAWFPVCTLNAKQFNVDNGKSQKLCIALGRKGGGVDLYSIDEGKIVKELKNEIHPDEITCMALCCSSNFLYATDRKCRILRWSLELSCVEVEFWYAKTNVPPTCIVSLSSNRVLVGSNQLSLWSLKNGTPPVVSELLGHSTVVNSMKQLKGNDGNVEFVLTTADRDREILLWKIDTECNLHKRILMNYAPTFVSCSIIDNTLMVSAVTGNESTIDGCTAHLVVVDNIRIQSISNTHTKSIATTTVRSSGSKNECVPIIAATVLDSNSQDILICYGSKTALRSEKIKYNMCSEQILTRIAPRSQPISPSDDATSHNALCTALDNRNHMQLQNVFKQHHDESAIVSMLSELKPAHIRSFIELLKKMKTTLNSVRWFKAMLEHHKRDLTEMASNEPSVFIDIKRLIAVQQKKTQILEPLERLKGKFDSI